MKKNLNLFIILIFCVMLSACQTGMDPAQMLQYSDSEITGQNEDYDILDKGPVPGGTLNIFTTEPDTLNPILTKNTYTADFLSFIYEGLTRLDENQRAVPVLADSWTVSPDGLIWDFHIRDGVRWQDGKAFTASDVEFTIRTIQNNSIDSVYKPLLLNIVTCTAVDSSDLRIALKKPDSFLPEAMTFPVLPKHQFSSRDVLSSSKQFSPVGTGPYAYVSYTPEKNVVMKANRDWWQLSAANDSTDDDNGMYIETIHANIFKSPEDAMGAFQLGEIDLAGIPAGDLAKYKGRTDLVIKKYASRNYEFLAFNMHNPVFSDPFARKAIDLAIDRDELINEVLPGEAEAARLPVLQESWINGAGETNGTDGTFPVSAIPYPTSDYTTEAAIINSTTPTAITATTPAEALTAGGWKQGNGGYYKYIGGARRYLRVSLLVNTNNTVRVRAAQKICEQLQKAGIPTELKQVAWNELLNSVAAFRYDMAFIGCRIPQFPDISCLYSNGYLQTALPGTGSNAFNVSGYSSPVIDANIASLFRETDDSRRITIFKALQNQIDKDTPYVGLYFLRDAMAYGKRLRGPLGPDTWNRFKGFTQWYKPEAEY